MVRVVKIGNLAQKTKKIYQVEGFPQIFYKLEL